MRGAEGVRVLSSAGGSYRGLRALHVVMSPPRAPLTRAAMVPVKSWLLVHLMLASGKPITASLMLEN